MAVDYVLQQQHDGVPRNMSIGATTTHNSMPAVFANVYIGKMREMSHAAILALGNITHPIDMPGVRREGGVEEAVNVLSLSIISGHLRSG